MDDGWYGFVFVLPRSNFGGRRHWKERDGDVCVKVGCLFDKVDSIRPDQFHSIPVEILCSIFACAKPNIYRSLIIISMSILRGIRHKTNSSIPSQRIHPHFQLLYATGVSKTGCSISLSGVFGIVIGVDAPDHPLSLAERIVLNVSDVDGVGLSEYNVS